ncbi:MAG: extracellular solute-binding protein [Lentisphaerae bacterium]|nr:extracellular solute-binding protein [Lentisphaerota bacterium]
MRYLSSILFLVVAALPYISMLPRNIGNTRQPQADEKLIIISPHRREVEQEYSRGFYEWMLTRYNRRVQIEWLDVGGTSKIMKDLESRYASNPHSPGVDLLFGGGITPYYQALEHDWLRKTDLPNDVLSPVPAICAGAPVYDPDMRWFGVALSGFGIIYNRILINRLGMSVPETWEALGRPEYLSWIASGDPRSSGSVHMCYEIILQVYGFEDGWRLITRICANVRRFGESGGVVPREVASGDVVAGMVIDQYAQTVIDSIGSDALGFILPRDATVIGADAVAVLQGAPSPELAELFIRYILSEEGQRILFQNKGVNGQRNSLHRLPVIKSLYNQPDAPQSRPYDYTGDFVYDNAKGGRRWNLINDMIGVRLIDAHSDLVQAWKAVVETGMHPELVSALCAPPMPESQFDELAKRWNDPRERVTITLAWANEATRLYNNITMRAKQYSQAKVSNSDERKKKYALQ